MIPEAKTKIITPRYESSAHEAGLGVIKYLNGEKQIGEVNDRVNGRGMLTEALQKRGLGLDDNNITKAELGGVVVDEFGVQVWEEGIAKPDVAGMGNYVTVQKS